MQRSRSWSIRVLAPLAIASLTTGFGCTSSPSDVPRLEVSLDQIGGFAGFHFRFEVWSDGRLVLVGPSTTEKEGRATDTQMRRLRDIVGSPEFRALAASYLPDQTCCDRYFYTVGVMREDRLQTVTTMDYEVEWPEPLGKALALLFEMRQQVAIDAPSPLLPTTDAARR
jgi:hypothetical protein